MKKLNS